MRDGFSHIPETASVRLPQPVLRFFWQPMKQYGWQQATGYITDGTPFYISYIYIKGGALGIEKGEEDILFRSI